MMGKVNSRGIFIFGVIFLCFEILKQSYLYLIVYDGEYDVWYFPFQICSLPIYLCLIFGVLYWKNDGTYSKIGPVGTSLMTFLQNFGLLGGVMSLIVRDGFTFVEHPILTIHGYIWHIGMIILSIYIFVNGLSSISVKGYLGSLIVFAVTAAIAFVLNIKLHQYGDVDMFYISPYHLSSQPFFNGVDAKIGRPLGIAFYLFATAIGALICHLIYWLISKLGYGRD